MDEKERKERKITTNFSETQKWEPSEKTQPSLEPPKPTSQWKHLFRLQAFGPSLTEQAF